MEYLKKSGIRGVLSFTTQHIARPNNPTDREIYKQAVQQWNEGKRLRYDKLDPSLQKHKNTQTFLNYYCPLNFCLFLQIWADTSFIVSAHLITFAFATKHK